MIQGGGTSSGAPPLSTWNALQCAYQPARSDCEADIMPLLSVLVAAAQTWTACSCARSPWTWPLMCSRTERGAHSGAALFTYLSPVPAT